MLQNKYVNRKIGPKINDLKTIESKQVRFKPRLYENKINFDRMRKYRLNRIREQLEIKDYSNGNFDDFFEENMTISIESYIGEVGGKEGVKLEDQFLITKDDLKQLSNFPI